MKVSDLKEGELYITSPQTIHKFSKEIIHDGKIITVCNIWKHYSSKSWGGELSRYTMIYL